MVFLLEPMNPRILDPYLRFFGNQACHCLSFFAFSKDSFTVKQDSEVFKEPEKFVRFQEIFGLSGPSCGQRSVFKEVSLEDYLSSFSDSLSDLRDEPAFEEVETSDEVISLFLNLIMIEVNKVGVHLDAFFPG